MDKKPSAVSLALPWAALVTIEMRMNAIKNRWKKEWNEDKQRRQELWRDLKRPASVEEIKHFFYWGLGAIGVLTIFGFFVDLFRLVFLNGTFLWWRQVVTLIIGMSCLTISVKKLRRLS